MFEAFAAGKGQDSVSRSEGRPERQSYAGRVYQHVRKGVRLQDNLLAANLDPVQAGCVTEFKERKTISIRPSVNVSSEKIFYYCDLCAASEARPSRL
ncbi:hypothetical protein PHYSODRAFT_286787 [Phytophthora sojae]|uniref:Uncharacterized protein n=1 Tax=Phytophthora sojae (strain P6497) TaxID=1094619 RepID=G4ZVH6_PHYSP|nr:hypothetical protein PHYSODRAFT_286787 [Phytophthora sojae]EGZ11494.1 hypothetical protein PHYSODRAFT_286787 [Phytophthora sojae]|eukprot:XP_009531827.1 hypothetical protein PHYSODRAFT_286787 [Phytophthora sojae]